MKGGRRADEEKKEEEKKEDTGILGGLFGTDEKKEEPAADVPATDAPAAAEVPKEEPAEEPKEEPKEEGGMFSGIMGSKEEPAAATEKKGKKGKKRRGKYYTSKQLKNACARLAHNKRARSKKIRKYSPVSQAYIAPAGQNPYEFGTRM